MNCKTEALNVKSQGLSCYPEMTGQRFDCIVLCYILSCILGIYAMPHAGHYSVHAMRAEVMQ